MPARDAATGADPGATAGSAARVGAGRVAVPRWLPATTVALAAAGIAVAGYLTYEHFTAAATLACPDTGVVSCAKVTASDQSSFLGVPVAPLGLGYFVAVLVAGLPAAWRVADPRLRLARLAAAAAGSPSCSGWSTPSCSSSTPSACGARWCTCSRSPSSA
jgi:uncharacterized membrane protein